MYGARRALYDGFAMAFKTLLKNESGEALEKLIVKHLLKGQAPKVRRSFGRSRTRAVSSSSPLARPPGVFFLTRGFFSHSGAGPPLQPAGPSRVGSSRSLTSAHFWAARAPAPTK